MSVKSNSAMMMKYDQGEFVIARCICTLRRAATVTARGHITDHDPKLRNIRKYARARIAAADLFSHAMRKHAGPQRFFESIAARAIFFGNAAARSGITNFTCGNFPRMTFGMGQSPRGGI